MPTLDPVRFNISFLNILVILQTKTYSCSVIMTLIKFTNFFVKNIKYK